MFSQIYSSEGEFEEIGVQNILNATYAGLYSDTYITPCRNVNNTCKNGLTSGRDQAIEILNRLANDNILAFLALKIQEYKNWPKDQVANQQFILDFTNTIWEAYNNETFNSGVAIVTSYNDWINIVGPSWTGASGMDLDWVYWNGKQDLTTGWVPFGGWTAPCFHQYAGNIVTNNCTGGVPINYYYYGNCYCTDAVCYNEFHKRRMITFRNRTQKFARYH
uniref:C-type lectin domain-containing protein n=1 Tax=Acrobeloides nanus TaxID=290746 RepID=A0A914DZ89_9BILA